MLQPAVTKMLQPAVANLNCWYVSVINPADKHVLVWLVLAAGLVNFNVFCYRKDVKPPGLRWLEQSLKTSTLGGQLKNLLGSASPISTYYNGQTSIIVLLL